MNGRYANPYANLGKSAAGIVGTFMNRGGIENAGYLDASKQMADIESTRAGTQKILAELERDRAADAIGPEQMAFGTTPEDWQMQKMYEAEGRYGETPLPQGMSGPPEPIYDRPESLTDADVGAMQRARAVDTILRKTGGSGTGMKSIMEALAGPGPEEGAVDMNNPHQVASLLSKGDNAIYYNAIVNGKATPAQALAAVVAYHTELNPKDIGGVLAKIDPMMVLQTLNQEPHRLGEIMGSAIRDFQSGYSGRGKRPTNPTDPLGIRAK